MRSVFLVAGLVLTGLLVLQPSVAQETTINVTTLDDVVAADGECSLREALANAAAGSQVHADCLYAPSNIIVLPAGTIELNGSQLVVSGQVTIQGVSPTDTIIDAGGVSRIFLIDAGEGVTVALLDMALTNGSAGDGGAVFIQSAGEVVLERMRVTASVATAEGGGGVAVSEPASPLALTITATTFSGNDAALVGGALSFFSPAAGGSLVITNSVLSSNHADDGGAVYTTGVGLTIEGTQFLTNNALQGGALQLAGPDPVLISNSSFSGNLASGTGGGAIFIAGSFLGAPDVTIVNSQFFQNSATGLEGKGGAIAHVVGDLAIADSTFTSNTAKGRGGAVAVYQGAPTAVVESSNFTGNSAEDGGAIAVFDTFANPTLTIEDSTFTANQADSHDFQGRGGAIYFHFGSLQVTRSQFVDNGAIPEGSGGAIAIHAQPGRLTDFGLTDSLLQENFAVDGGGLAIFGQNASVLANISRSTFRQNFAAEGAAALYASLGSIQVLNSTFEDNLGGVGSIAVFGAGTTLVGTHLTVAAGPPQLLLVGSGLVTAGSNAGVILRNSVVVRVGHDVQLACAGITGGTINGTSNADDDGTCPNAIDVEAGDLHALGDHGGETPTRPPVAGSPLIDAASQAFCPPTDQRGVPRPIGPACDIGAVEALFELVLPGVARE